MRRFAAAIASLALVAASSAVAATPDAVRAQQALFGAAFASPSTLEIAEPGLSLGGDGHTGARYVPGQGLLHLVTGQAVNLGGGASFVDSVRISTAGYDARPGAALLRPYTGESVGAQSYELTLIRNWPAALTVDAGRLTLDVTPHAGFGVSSGGGQSAEAGALVRLQDKMLRAVEMAGRGSHLYLFAGASGRAVGLNLVRSQGAVRPDQDNGFVREAEAGFGLQRGFLQASVGVSQQRTTLRALGETAKIDNRVGLTLSIR